MGHEEHAPELTCITVQAVWCCCALATCACKTDFARQILRSLTLIAVEESQGCHLKDEPLREPRLYGSDLEDGVDVQLGRAHRRQVLLHAAPDDLAPVVGGNHGLSQAERKGRQYMVGAMHAHQGWHVSGTARESMGTTLGTNVKVQMCYDADAPGRGSILRLPAITVVSNQRTLRRDCSKNITHLRCRKPLISIAPQKDTSPSPCLATANIRA